MSSSVSISQRYNRSVLQTVLIFTIICSAGLAWFGFQAMEKELRKKVDHISALAQTALPNAIWTYEVKGIEETLNALFLDEDVVYLAIQMDGETLGIKQRKAFPDKNYDYFQKLSSSFVSTSLGIFFGGNEIATVEIVLSKERFHNTLIRNIGIAILFAFLLSFLIIARTLEITKKYIFTPLHELERSSSQIAQGNLETALHYEVEDEIGRLGNSFDQMRLSIQSTLSDLNTANSDLHKANITLEDRVRERTASLAASNASLATANKDIMDSIHYALLIQNALLPGRETFHRFFIDSFDLWSPKDVVGGDIILLAGLPNSEESILMVIDCTGHGVPGAFVSMLVKAIERELVMNLSSTAHSPSPAKILQVFNQSIKNLLKQDSQNSSSNAGFDGAVLCYNKAEKTVRFSGAGLPLFYLQNKKLKVIKGDRQSVGYTKIPSDYKYTEHTLKIEEETLLYLTTDGYFDQPGGPKGFPFGRKRVQRMIQKVHSLPFSTQRELILEELNAWRGERERVDDVSFVGLKLTS